jgi:hypothetical protein
MTLIIDNNPPSETEAPKPKRGFLRQFYYDLLLFCGVQTQSNLSATRPEPVKTRGIFLFRK